MASKARGVNSYLRDVIAPLVFPGGFIEKSDKITGNCPECQKGDDHCSITILNNDIVGYCYHCKWTLEKFRAENPEYDALFEGYKKFLESNDGSSLGTLEKDYYYTNASGRVLYRKQKYRKRNGKKTFLWQRLESDGKTYSNNLPAKEHAPIYRLHEISADPAEMPADGWVYLCEGEKDADSIVSLMHLPATCLPNGAVKKNTRFHPDWLSPFKDLRVIVMSDNDSEGITSAEVLVEKLLPIASVVKKIMPTDLLGCSEVEISDKKKGYDVTDYIEEVGAEVAYQTIKRLSAEKPPELPEDPTEKLPDWIIVKITAMGNESRSINEPKFSRYFKQKYKVSRINGIYYTDGESVTDDYVMKLLQGEIQGFFVEKTGNLVQQVNKTLENACYAVQPEPDDRKIYCRGNVSLILDVNGNAVPCNEEVFSLTRIPAKYDPTATCPTFEKYLSDLLFEDDIPVVQEFFGYCLVPCTRAQAGLFIHGKGGEGKSVLRDVIMRLFGHAAIQESIHQLEERFVIANLENRLVCIDDDMQADLLGKTGTLKKLITAKEKMQVERKNKQKYDAYIYARVIGIGNSFIGSKFDHSEGFYRRQLLIDCKPKTRPAEQDDSFMSDKCVNEISGILNWALAGLRRLMQNGYHFSVSERMKETMNDTKKDNDNTLAFFEDTMYIKISDNWTEATTSADLFAAYAYWCRDNNETPVLRRSFQRRTGERYKDRKGKVCGVNGYFGFSLPQSIRDRVNRITSIEHQWLDRLP